MPPTDEEVRALVRRVCEVPYDRWLAEVKRQKDEALLRQQAAHMVEMTGLTVEEAIVSILPSAQPWARMDPAAVEYRARFGL